MFELDAVQSARMNYVSELLEDYPPTMSARLLAFLLTAGSGRPEEEYRAQTQAPLTNFRTKTATRARLYSSACPRLRCADRRYVCADGIAGCLKKYPQLTMRTHVRALAAIVEHASKTGDEQGAFALGVKLCNLRAAAKWGIEHYQRRIQVACRPACRQLAFTAWASAVRR